MRRSFSYARVVLRVKPMPAPLEPLKDGIIRSLEFGNHRRQSGRRNLANRTAFAGSAYTPTFNHFRRNPHLKNSGRQKARPDDKGVADDSARYGRRRLYRKPHGSRAGGCRRSGGRDRQSVDRLLRDAAGRRAAVHRRRRRREPRRGRDRQPRRRRHHPFRRLDHRAAIDPRPAALLSQQHDGDPQPAPGRGPPRHQQVHLLLDRRRLRQSRCRARARGRSHAAAVALRHLEADDRDHAARRRPRRGPALRRAALLQRRRRRPAGPHRARPPSARRICSRSRSRPRPASAPRSTCSAPIIRRRTEAASATSSMSRTWRRRIAPRSPICAPAAASTTLNCGYGRGYSVLETIEAVRRISGRNFAVQYTDRRPGDIAAIVADVRRLQSTLEWMPQYDSLDMIITHALAWEEKLLALRHERRTPRGRRGEGRGDGHSGACTTARLKPTAFVSILPRPAGRQPPAPAQHPRPARVRNDQNCWFSTHLMSVFGLNYPSARGHIQPSNRTPTAHGSLENPRRRNARFRQAAVRGTGPRLPQPLRARAPVHGRLRRGNLADGVSVRRLHQRRL